MLIRTVLHMVVMTGCCNRTSTVTEVLLDAVPFYVDMSYILAVLLPDVCVTWL